MFAKVLTKVFGSKNERDIRKLSPVVEAVNAVEERVKALSDEDIRSRTAVLREQLGNGMPIEELLPEAFALVREASVRTLGMRHFDCQLIGGRVLHEVKIDEMKTTTIWPAATWSGWARSTVSSACRSAASCTV